MIRYLSVDRKDKSSMTKKVTIRLNSIDSGVHIIDLNSRSDCETVFTQEKFVVNGVSILGLFSLCLIADSDVLITGEEKDIDDLVREYKENGIVVKSETEDRAAAKN